jgi:hypothetical protein
MQAFFGAKTPLSGFGPIPGSAAEMSRGLCTGDGVDAVLPKSHVRLHSRLSRQSGVGGVQRCA